jgi:hypothetical protein
MSDNTILDAMRILGGKKNKAQNAPTAAPRQPVTEEAKPRPWLPQEASKAAPAAPAAMPSLPSRPIKESNDVIGRMAKAERVVVKELARFATLHAAILDMKYEMENGSNPALVEQRLDEMLKVAKVTIK